MLCIIPARGGSKGLPGKNIKSFNGKPLIAYTIELAKKSQNIERVIVSTDDVEIANVAKSCGAEVPFLRPADLATDDASALDTYIYTIEELKKREGVIIDDFIVLQPTSPLRRLKHIDEAITLYHEKNADSVVSVSVNEHPVEWLKEINEDGKLQSLYSSENLNRQMYKEYYYPNGVLFIFDYEKIKECREYYMDRTYPYIMDSTYSVDIDTIIDFEYAEFLSKRLNKVTK